MNRYLPLVLVLAVLAGCTGTPDAIPRPRAFPRIIYPDRVPVSLSETACPFTFQYSDYFTVELDKSFFGEDPMHGCWFDLYSEAFDARLHCSYYPIDQGKSFDELVADAFRIANKINQRSNYMDEIAVANEQGAGGLILEFQGPAASPMHFFLTDSTNHFFKASLYYNTKVRPDSLAPITEFLKADIAQIVNSFKWQ